MDSYSVRRSAFVRHSGIVRLRPHMAPDRTRSAKRGDKLRLAATTINGDSGCAGPNCSKGRSLPEQFLHQRSFQHHAFRPHANTDRDTYQHSNGNADTECNTNSDDYAKAYTHATARTDAKASSVTSAQTVIILSR